tara:strand:- start:105 stop:572 length:468 start_codon:yes stop_codon:yes gene_type:complete
MQKTQILLKNRVNFEIANSKDLNLINEIESELKLQLTSLSRLNFILNNHFSFLWKIVYQRDLIGFIQILGDFIESEIISIGVTKKFQRQGIGKKVIKFLNNKGFNNIFLEVSEKNTKALNFYYSMGFKMIEIREKYYRIDKKKPENAIILNLKII